MSLRAFICAHASCCVDDGLRGVRSIVSFRDTFPLIVGGRSSLPDECARRADRMMQKATTVIRNYRKQYCKTPLVNFSVNRQERYDLGNATTDNALIGLRDITRRNARTIAFFMFFSWKEVSARSAILFPKTAHMSPRCVAAQRLTFGFGSVRSSSKVRFIELCYDNEVTCTINFVSSVPRSSIKGVWHSFYVDILSLFYADLFPYPHLQTCFKDSTMYHFYITNSCLVVSLSSTFDCHYF